MVATAWYRGEGGSVMQMDLPLPEGIAQRVKAGAIVRVAGPDGAPYAPAEGDAPAPAPPTTRPLDSALKADWVAWAVACGADYETVTGATRHDLIDKYGSAAVVG